MPDKQDWQRVGARSRDRGKSFERDIADMFGWRRVPFSGRNAEFGEGDVIDGTVGGAGFWLAECKMRTRGSETVVIERGWIHQMADCAERSGRFPLLVVGTKHDRDKPSRNAVVLLPPESRDFLFDRVVHARNRVDFSWAPRNRHELHRWIIARRTTGGGFVITRGELEGAVAGVQVLTDTDEHTDQTWLVFKVDAFALLVRQMQGAAIPRLDKEDE